MAQFLALARQFVRWSSADLGVDEGKAADAISRIGSLAERAAAGLSDDVPLEVRRALQRIGELAPLVAMAGDQVGGAATERLGGDVATVVLWADGGQLAER